MQKCLIVLGMHRSGTSAVSGFLHKLGITLGSNLLIPNEFNEKGYFENSYIVDANDNILQTLGSSWDGLFLLEERWWRQPQLIPHRNAVKKIIKEEFHADELFCIKDPRISMLLPFWISVLQELNIEISFVVPLRKPIEVAESLKLRDGFSIQKGLLLWMNNMLSIEHYSRPFRREFLRFDDFLESPADVMHSLLNKFNINVPDVKSKIDTIAKEFLDPKLKHHNIEFSGIDSDEMLLIDRFNAILFNRNKSEEPDKDDLIAIDAIRDEYKRLSSLYYNQDIRNEFLALKITFAEHNNLSQTISEQKVQINGLRRELSERDMQIVNLSQTVSRQKVRINGFIQVLSTRDFQFASLEQKVNEQECRIASLDQVLSERDAQIRELRLVASEQDERLRLLDHVANKRDLALNSLTAELSRITSSRSWQLTGPLRLTGRFLRGDWKAIRDSIIFLRNAKKKPLVMAEETPVNKDVILKDGAYSLKNRKNISSAQVPFRNKRILLVSYYCPSRAHAGGLRILDIYSLIKSTFSNVQIDLYTHKRPEVDWSYEDVEKIFDNIFLSPVENLSLSGFNQLHTVESPYDVIDLQFHQSAYDMKSWRKVGHKIIFTPMESLLRGLQVSLKYRNITSMQKFLKDIILAKEELMFVRKADEVVCVSERDASSLRLFCQAGKIYALETAVSNIEFTDVFDYRNEILNPGHKQHVILYIAYFGSETNVNALKWYLINVHPLISKTLPDYKLQVVGRGDLSAFKEYQSPSIEFVGAVPKLTTYIRKAKVGVAPALNGGGFRGKINQYSIYGVPVVASTIAAKGLAYQDGYDIFITDQYHLFAERCIQLLRENDLNRAMGQRAREKAFTQYTWESKIDAIKKIYNLEVA